MDRQQGRCDQARSVPAVPVSAGPLPKTSSIAFTATQTYSDGTVVKWDQPVVEGGPEPEHPALTLEPPAASEHGGSAQVASASSSTDTAAAPSSISPWSIAAFLVAVAALVVGVVAFGMARGKRQPATALIGGSGSTSDPPMGGRSSGGCCACCSRHLA